ncbi:MAG: carbamoyltransferase C-terminal domain-containing protein [Acidobacteriota bacterium]|nr:carbamoyltransferase C-terminal domain-containing protein [Acidobacteriota bacterium]
MSSPIVVGINRTQDASICAMDAEAVRFSVQKERLTRVKHAWGRRGDLKSIYRPRLPQLADPVDLVVECYSSDPQVKYLAEYRAELEECLRFREAPRVVEVSHHLAHAYGSFFPAGFSRAAVMVVDFQGSPVSRFTEGFPREVAVSEAAVFRGAEDPVEVASYYLGDGRSLECLDKQLWNRSAGELGGLGFFFYQTTQCLFPGAGREGILMGLASYGDPDALGLPPLEVRGGRVIIPRPWSDLWAAPWPFRFFIDGQGRFEDCAHLAAAAQRAFEEALVEQARWLRQKTGAEALVYTGGCALNCAANARLVREAGYRSVYIPPAPHDGGTALGCALYGLVEELGVTPGWRWAVDFLGPEPELEPALAVLDEDPEVDLWRPEDWVETVTAALARGEVVALFQGGSESGPRALGHRSLLADPRYRAMTDFINREVKERQWFRPLAPVVTERSQGEIFELHRPSPFMQLAVSVRPPYRDRIPAAVHADGTARLQTVTAEHHPLLFALLESFGRRTGLEVLLNTSFNGPGEPIVETLQEAVDFFLQRPVHLLAVPPYLIRKRREVPHPLRT